MKYGWILVTLLLAVLGEHVVAGAMAASAEVSDLGGPGAGQTPASPEQEYTRQLRAALAHSKRYPTQRQPGRERASGTVKVAFTLTRDGHLADSHVQESSNIIELDDAALAAVRHGNYPPMPSQIWASQGRHRFTAELVFAPQAP